MTSLPFLLLVLQDGDKLTLIPFAVLGVKTKSNCNLTFENKKNNLKQFYVKQNSLFQHKL